MYANENKGKFPRTVFQPTAPRHAAYTNPTAPDPFRPGGVAANDVTGAMFLLLRTQDITPARFICPAAEVGEAWDFGGRRANEVSNFPSRQYLTYSYASPYPSQAALDAGYRLSYTLTSDFAVVADMNPGVPALATIRPEAGRAEHQAVNSANHRGDGQNVLYADGHVEYQATVFAGMSRSWGQRVLRDNVYTAGGPDRPAANPFSPPQDQLDSVLLPTAREGPAPAPGAPSPRAAWGSDGGIVIGGLPPPPAAGRSGSPGAAAAAPTWFWVLLVLGVLILLALAGLALVVILRPARAAAGMRAAGTAPGPVHPYAPQPYYGSPPPPPLQPQPPVRREPPPLP